MRITLYLARTARISFQTYEEHLAAMQSTEQNISVDDSAIENQDSLKQ